LILTGKEKFIKHKTGLFIPERKRPMAIDLFSGCGGLSLGLLQAGFEVVAAVDYDCSAMVTYLANLGSYPVNIHFIEGTDRERFEECLDKIIKHSEKETGVARIPTSGCYHTGEYPPVKNVWLGDIRKLKGQDILDAIGMEVGEVDLVAGGPPCQGFSQAGKRNIMDPRNSLVFDFARMVLEIMPKSILMENVPGMLSMVTPEGIPVIDAFCKILADGGFGSYKGLKKVLLNTSGAGAAIRNDKKQREHENEQIKLFA